LAKDPRIREHFYGQLWVCGGLATGQLTLVKRLLRAKDTRAPRAVRTVVSHFLYAKKSLK
jgi:hypothetical protein